MASFASSASRPEKLAKLQHFKAGLPHHTQRALHAILEEAKKSGIPELISPKQQREARRALLSECTDKALGPIILEATLEGNQFYYTNLLTYLATLFFRGGASTNCSSPSTKSAQAHHNNHGGLSCTWMSWCLEMC